jgi:hypothetical protein
MFTWIAKRPAQVHRADGDGELVLAKGTTVLCDMDSPMQDRITFFVEATWQRCWMDSDYFIGRFERI